MPDNGLAPPNMPWLWQPNSPVGQPNGLGPPMLNYAAPPNQAAPTVGQGVAQTAADVAQALPSWPSVEEQRRMLQPLPGWQGTAVDAAKQWAEGVMMGTTAPGDVPPPGIVAYHGSPHSFDQFDTSKIGTGEGAQAYGHGLYMAGNEAVAQSYKGAGPAANAQLDAINTQLSQLSKQMDQYSTGQYGKYNDPKGYELKAQYDALMDQRSNLGHMYQVNIGADPEHFLDWDKPLSEQSQHVQDALAKVHAEDPEAWQRMVASNQKGPELYESGGIQPSTQAQALQQAGIPGIRYLDQGSRAARDPIKLVGNQPYDPSDPTHLASHAMDMASGDRTAAAAIADRHAQLRAAEGDTAGADAMRQASTLLQSPRTIPPMTEGQPPGTHNYVVFDANTIDILRKYGIAGLIAGGGAAAAATQQQQPSQ